MKELRDMTEPELRSYCRELAGNIETQLPPGPSRHGKCLFVLIVMDTCEGGIGQYVSNAERAGIIKTLRETADRLDTREDIPR